MARQLTPLGIVVVSVLKWIAIPLFVAFIGFAVIAPLIGSAPSKPAERPKDQKQLSEHGKKFQSVRANEH